MTTTRTPRIACGGDLCKNKARVGRDYCGTCQTYADAETGAFDPTALARAATAKARESGPWSSRPGSIGAAAIAAGQAAQEAKAEPTAEAVPATTRRKVVVIVDGHPVETWYTTDTRVGGKWSGRGTWALPNGLVVRVDAGAWSIVAPTGAVLEVVPGTTSRTRLRDVVARALAG